MQDPNVHPDNVAKVREKLDAFGIKYEVLTFDDEGHGIKKIKNQKILYSELANFFTAAFLDK
jgi:dipeptidyl aminopeptidase/acylaminoacyl peptidase